MAAGAEDVAKVVLLLGVDLAEHPLEQDLGEPDDGVERGPQLVAHVREELTLMTARDLELAALLLDLVEEPDVLDRDRRLVGERLHELDLAIRERADREPSEDDRPQDVAFAEHGHSEHGSRSRLLDDPRFRQQVGLRRHVRHVDRAPLADQPVHDRALDMEQVAPVLPPPEDHVRIARFRVSGAPVERVGLDLLGHPGYVRVRKARRALDHGLECRLDVEDGPAQRLQDVAHRGLAFERGARFVEQAHVLDRDGRLVGERLDELDGALVEWPDVVSGEHDAADDPALPKHWHSEDGPRFGQADDEGLPEDRIGLRVRDLDCRSALEDRAHHATLGPEGSPLAAEVAGRAVPCERLADVGREAAAVGDRLEPLALDTREPTDIGAGEADGVLENDVEDRLEIERGAADRLQNLADRGLLFQAFSCFVEQPDVLDRYRGLVGERLDELDLPALERSDRAAQESDGTDRLGATHERYSEHGVPGPRALLDRLVVLGIGEDVCDMDRAAAKDRAACHVRAIEWERPHPHEVCPSLRVAAASNELESIPLEYPEMNELRLAQHSSVLADRVEDRL